MDLKKKNSTSEKWAGNDLRDRVNVAKTWKKSWKPFSVWLASVASIEVSSWLDTDDNYVNDFRSRPQLLFGMPMTEFECFQ